MSDPMPPPQSEDDDTDDSQDVNLRDVVDAFLRAFPTPTDQQLHAFSEALGVPYETFEEQVFQMFGEELEQREDLETLLEDEEGLVVDDLDMFLVSFFLFIPSPTEKVVHQMAELVSITPEDLEERIYRMLATLRESSEDDESDDEDSDFGDSELDDEDVGDDDDTDSSDDTDDEVDDGEEAVDSLEDDEDDADDDADAEPDADEDDDGTESDDSDDDK